MKPEATGRLLDALAACERILQFTAERPFGDFISDEYFQSAIYWQLAVLGEAFSIAEQVEPDIKEAFPEIRKIVGLRNRIIHGYDEIEDQIIWDTIQHDVPTLRRHLEVMLRDVTPPHQPA